MKYVAILLSSVSFARAFMNGTCETVMIITEAGPVVINKSDYDRNPDGYTLHDAAAVDPNALRDDGPTIAEFVAAGYPASNYPPQGYASKSTVEEIAAATPAPTPAAVAADEAAKIAQTPAPTLAVMQDGKKHFVTDQAGERVKLEGIDAKGYASAQDAWNAILALPR